MAGSVTDLKRSLKLSICGFASGRDSDIAQAVDPPSVAKSSSGELLRSSSGCTPSGTRELNPYANPSDIQARFAWLQRSSKAGASGVGIVQPEVSAPWSQESPPLSLETRESERP